MSDREEILELRRCCTQRGARLQILKEWMRLTDWYHFLVDYPEAEEWFDKEGVPK